ncbi:MAG: putative metal-binding motif-containing protein [Myxococcales bacterium]|nr:MAG: putative metal-binding motif-containing protein [Myxococcales bacterium]
MRKRGFPLRSAFLFWTVLATLGCGRIGFDELLADAGTNDSGTTDGAANDDSDGDGLTDMVDCAPQMPDPPGTPGVGDPCDGNDLDQCEDGSIVCESGMPVCNDTIDDMEHAEICDGVDNDCDGSLVDDGTDDCGAFTECIGAAGCSPVRAIGNFGSIADDFVFDALLLSDGDLLFTGISNNTAGQGDFDLFLTRLSLNGTIRWTTLVGGSGYDAGLNIAELSNGDFMVIGETESFGAGDRDFYLVRVDGTGALVSTSVHGGSGAERIGNNGHIEQLADNSFLLVGFTQSAEFRPSGGGGEEAIIVSVDENGNDLWAVSMGGNGNEYIAGAASVSSGNIIAAGTTDSFGNGLDDTFLLHLTNDGTPLSATAYGQNGYDTAYGLAHNSGNDDIFLIGLNDTYGGFHTPFSFGADIFIHRFSGTGVLQELIVLERDASEMFVTLAASEQNTLYFAGHLRTSAVQPQTQDTIVGSMNLSANLNWATRITSSITAHTNQSYPRIVPLLNGTTAIIGASYTGTGNRGADSFVTIVGGQGGAGICPGFSNLASELNREQVTPLPSPATLENPIPLGSTLQISSAMMNSSTGGVAASVAGFELLPQQLCN